MGFLGGGTVPLWNITSLGLYKAQHFFFFFFEEYQYCFLILKYVLSVYAAFRNSIVQRSELPVIRAVRKWYEHKEENTKKL